MSIIFDNLRKIINLFILFIFILFFYPFITKMKNNHLKGNTKKCIKQNLFKTILISTLKGINIIFVDSFKELYQTLLNSI
jgi:hypothetical protein